MSVNCIFMQSIEFSHFVVLGNESRTCCILGKLPNTEIYPGLVCFINFETMYYQVSQDALNLCFSCLSHKYLRITGSYYQAQLLCVFKVIEF